MGNVSSTFLVTLAILIMLIFIFFIISEVPFNIFYFFLNGSFYKKAPKLDLDKIYVETNPYLPYVLKSNFSNEKSSVADYPLHRGKFYYGNYTTNNLGYLNGPDGSRNIEIPKPDNIYRINCLGASTTGNYICSNKENFSYPNELEDALIKFKYKNIEVNNFGIGGYNSADILINYALNVVETNADLIIIYHAYNDIDEYLISGFKPDYRHSRKNLGESFWKFIIAQQVPNFPFKFMHYIAEYWLPKIPRNSLLKNIRRGDINLDINPKDELKIFKRNIQSIIDIAKSNNTKILLSTFCHHLHNDIKESKLHKKYQEIVLLENEIIREISLKNEILLVDNANLIPKEDKYFVDSIHFSPDGMKLLASNFADAITKSNII